MKSRHLPCSTATLVWIEGDVLNIVVFIVFVVEIRDDERMVAYLAVFFVETSKVMGMVVTFEIVSEVISGSTTVVITDAFRVPIVILIILIEDEHSNPNQL